MADFVFDDPGGTAVTAKLQESSTIDGTKSAVDTATIANLTLSDGKRQWTVAVADGSNYYWLSFLDASGDEGPMTLLPPQSSSDTFTIQVNSIDVVGTAVSGLAFKIRPYPAPQLVSGDDIIMQESSATTDALGFAELRPRAGAGLKYRVSLSGVEEIIDATSLGGTTVNFKDYV